MAADLAVRSPSRVSRVLTGAILALLILLSVEVLLEAWVQELLGDRYVQQDHILKELGGTLPEWPKTLKNGLLIALVAMSAVKITVERRLREFTTRADLALVALAVVMVLAGLFGTSGPVLIGQALFVYFRGAIVFYAVRALRPSWAQFQKVLWVAGAILAVDVLVALVQMFIVHPAYTGVGWVDLTWADIHRAQGLLDHPNHLGHILGVVLVGMVAWMAGLERIPRRWWAVFTVTALGLASTQSRESMIAALIGAAVVWYLRRGGGRVLLLGGGIIVLLFGANMLVRPENVSEILFRLRGVNHAIVEPAGQENCDDFATMQECTMAGATESKEIRILFLQQGMRLLLDRPILGYGVGQFGGIVAEQHDPQWEKDPRFGPEGFKLYDFTGVTVDSFFLHLVVEVGLLGFVLYLLWLYSLVQPLIRSTRRFGSVDRAPPAEPGEQTEPREQTGLWAIGTLVFAFLVAILSPALEDPLFPPLVFGVLGIGWVLDQRAKGGEPATPPADPQPAPATESSAA